MKLRKKKLEWSITLALSLSYGISQAQFSAELNLIDLNGSNGVRINGVNADDFSGASVSYAGDINGDGIDDVIIGAFGADPNGNEFAGSSYVVFGSATGLPHPFSLSSLNGSNGFVINGLNENDLLGRSVSHAGDINGDGFDDLIIGVPAADPNGITSAGRSYVIYGKNTVFSNPFDLSLINGLNGFVMNGNNLAGFLGNPVSYAGDINNDGVNDIVIGAVGGLNDGTSNAYVVFGDKIGLPNPFNMSSLNGSNGFVMNGVNDFDFLGISVSNAGDVNGDGKDDLIIGANGSDPNDNELAGSSYVVFGKSSNFNSSFDLTSLNGSNGFVIEGENSGDNSGFSVSSAGDINGDGIGDLIIGAKEADYYGTLGVGISYVIFGKNTDFVSPFNLSNINGLNGFVINGLNANDLSGFSVSSAGDINGDGNDDVIIGAPGADPGGNSSAGSTYVVFGNDTGLPNPFNLSNIDGINGFVINGIAINDSSGSSVSHAGDFNGDGIDDIIIGANGARVNLNIDAGASYVIFGREKPIFKDGFE